MKQINLLIIFLLAYVVNAVGQIATDTWKTHFSYNVGASVTMAHDKIFVVGSGYLFSYSLDDSSIETYSKINGLSDISIALVRYYKEKNLLFIGYENGNVDLLVDQTIKNIQDIKLATITGSKKINSVCFNGDYAYVSTDFGIVVINLNKLEIKETYLLNSSSGQNTVNGAAVLNGTIYAASDNGLFKTELSNPNILNFATWDYETQLPDYNSKYMDVVAYEGHILAVKGMSADDYYTLYDLNAGVLKTLLQGGKRFRSLQVGDDGVVLSAKSIFYVLDKTLSLSQIVSSYAFEDLSYSTQNKMDIADIVLANAKTFFVADKVQGLVKYEIGAGSEVLRPSGPALNTYWDMDISEGGLRAVHGRLNSSWNNFNEPAAISIYKNNHWIVLDKKNIPEFGNAVDLVSVASDPLEPEHFFAASWRFGLFEFRGNEFVNHYDDSNSTLENIFTTSTYFRINGLSFDPDGKLWMTNSEVYNIIHCFDFNNSDLEAQWNALNYAQIDNAGSDKKFSLGETLVTNEYNKWVMVPFSSGGIFVFNENETFTDRSDDMSKMLSVSYDNEGEEFSTHVNCITEDLDGAIWVGTRNGVGVFYSPENVFEDGVMRPSRIKIPLENGEENEAGYLLNSEIVNAIAVDGGNRKWLGTSSSGLFLVSPDGITTVAHFTTLNSPLPSNSITSLAVDPESGEVFIGTAVGLVSYGGDATQGGTDFNQLKAYPNPVREDFTGVVTIAGLVEETIVKITDISGNLVYETVSNGGSVSWDRRNVFGDYVGTGVYIIFCATKDGSQSALTKLLIINSKQ